MSIETDVRPTPALLATLIPAPRQADSLPLHVQQQIDKAFKLKEKSNSRNRRVLECEINACWCEYQPVLAVKKIMQTFQDIATPAPSTPVLPASTPPTSAPERLEHHCQRKGRAVRKRRLVKLSA